MNRLHILILAVPALIAVFAERGLAIDSTWKTGGTANWFDAPNWTAGVPENAGDIARFSTTTFTTVATQLNSPASLGQLTYTGRGTFQLTGAGPLTFNNPAGEAVLNLLASSGQLSASVEPPIDIGAGETFSVNLQGQSVLQLRSQISGDGAVQYVGSPTGPMSSIQGNNTYSGLTTIELGTSSIDAYLATAFGAATAGTTLRSGTVSLLEGTAESFTVLRPGTLILTPTSTPQSGKIVVSGGTIIPVSRFTNEQDVTVNIDAEIEIQGLGYLGRSTSAMNDGVFRGAISGSGLLNFQGQSGTTLTARGSISVRGDVLASDRSSVIVEGAFQPAGDLTVNGGISGAHLRLAGDAQSLAGDVETRLGYVVVSADTHINTLKVDARLAGRGSKASFCVRCFMRQRGGIGDGVRELGVVRGPTQCGTGF